MNVEPGDFEELRKLLALKRHEQPPPRYFNEFSSNVIARLRTPEVLPEPTLLQRLGLDFQLRPAMVCAFGVVISALLLTGTIGSLGVDGNSTLQAMGTGPLDVDELSWSSGPVPGVSLASHRVENFGDTASSTIPVFSAPASSPFSQLAVHASKVNWAFARGDN